MRAQTTKDRREMLNRISAQLITVINTLNQMGFNARVNNKDPHSIVVEGKKMTDGATRKAVHDLMHKEGLMSVTDTIRVLVRMHNADGSESNYAKCEKCSYYHSVDYDKDGMAYVTHTHTLGPNSFDGEPDWCDWGHDSDEHRYPYKSVPGRIIIFHPDYQPRLPKQARARLAGQNRRQAMVTSMLCLRTMELPRDISYIIMHNAFDVSMRRIVTP
jgi:hypothetical protein